jgi:hypothetical protein
MDVVCERCGKTVPADAAEACGVCVGPLCVECWETVGYGPNHTDAEFRATWYVRPENRV